MRSLRSARLASAPLRRLSIALLTALTAALLVSGAALAQEESEAPNCANGVVIPEPENNPGLVADCEALLAAAPVLIGEEGGEAINWSDDTPILEWTGVLASSGRVTALDLSFMGLTGQLSPRLGELSQLTLISVRYNDLSGPIPTEFAQLTNLAWLLLYGNQLTGEIPAELGQLTQLLRMDIDQNRLSGEIPAELGDLPNLLELWLDDNLLTGSIPPALAGMSRIRHLSLTGNALRGPVPSEVRRAVEPAELLGQRQQPERVHRAQPRGLAPRPGARGGSVVRRVEPGDRRSDHRGDGQCGRPALGGSRRHRRSRGRTAAERGELAVAAL